MIGIDNTLTRFDHPPSLTNPDIFGVEVSLGHIKTVVDIVAGFPRLHPGGSPKTLSDRPGYKTQ
jgi:hypothetical protein